MNNNTLTLALFEGDQPQQAKLVYVTQSERLIDLVVENISDDLRKRSQAAKNRHDAPTAKRGVN
ncbi:MAG: hypothetical protein QUT30_16170 [Acidobacteriota bacterium]|nr:hypothetical protein [Acidobacteriota bacterium]